jgi:hypothetical protein
MTINVGDYVQYNDGSHKYIGTVVRVSESQAYVRIDPMVSDMQHHDNPDYLTTGGTALLTHWTLIRAAGDETKDLADYYDAVTGAQP